MTNPSFQAESKKHFFNGRQIRAFLYSDYSIEPHNHDFYEMNIVLRGKGTQKIEEASMTVRSGDVFVIPPNTVHSYSDTEGLDVYHILIHRDFISENLTEAVKMPGFLQLIEIEPHLRQNFSEAKFLHLSPTRLSELETELEFLQDNNDYDGENILMLKKHAAWKIIYWLSFLLYKQLYSKDKPTANKYEQAVLKSLEYIHTNYGEKITIEALCKMAYLSRSTFLRSFSQMCGSPPMEYLQKYRCRKALEMMNTAKHSKTETAHLCGFYDLSHMERIINKERAKNK